MTSSYLDSQNINKHRGWFLALGILLIILGIAALSAPMFTTLATETFLGVLILMGGVAQVALTFMSRSWGSFFLRLISGLVYLVGGWALLKFPLTGTLSLTLLLGWVMLFDGVFRLVLGFQAQPKTSWRIVIGGFISVLLGILVLAKWPADSAFAIGLFVGVSILMNGWAMVILSALGRDDIAEAPSKA